MSPSQFEQLFDSAWDRASLVALPPQSRPQYAEVLASLIRSQGRVLLVTIEYPPAQKEGPPFSVPDDQVQEHFAPFFAIELLEERPEPPRWGVDWVTERVYLLTRKESGRL